MAYGFNIECRNGLVKVVSSSGDIPGGRFEITGYDDGDTVRIAVKHLTLRGEHVIAAMHGSTRTEVHGGCPRAVVSAG